MQAVIYMDFLQPSDIITRTDGVIPDDMSSDCTSLTLTTLYSKSWQDNIISESFDMAQNLLKTTSDDFEFLQLLVKQIYPLLVVKKL